MANPLPPRAIVGLKRYMIIGRYGGQYQWTEVRGGDWVRFDELSAALDAQDAALVAMEREMRGLAERLSDDGQPILATRIDGWADQVAAIRGTK